MYDSMTVEEKLGCVDMALVGRIDHLSKLPVAGVRAHRGYAFPGQKYLAAQLGVSLRTIVSHIKRLRFMGILEVIHRRKKNGHWQTNLYKIVSYQHRGWMRVRNMLTSFPHRAQKAAHIVPRKTEDPIKDIRNEDERGKMAALMAELIAGIGRAKSP